MLSLEKLDTAENVMSCICFISVLDEIVIYVVIEIFH